MEVFQIVAGCFGESLIAKFELLLQLGELLLALVVQVDFGHGELVFIVEHLELEGGVVFEVGFDEHDQAQCFVALGVHDLEVVVFGDVGEDDEDEGVGLFPV